MHRTTIKPIVVVLIAIVIVISVMPANAMGTRTERPGPFLHWPLPSNISISAISRLPDSRWTHNFLGITGCPPYPAMIDGGTWGGESGGSSRNYLLPGVSDQRAKWNNRDGRIACYQGHAGIDITARDGTSVSAAAAGRVIEAHAEFILIRHDNVNNSGQTWLTMYRHVATARGDLVGKVVSAGDTIGTVGAGHLHFELAKDNKYDPNTRNPFGVDSAPWDGCLWANQALCPAAPSVAPHVENPVVTPPPSAPAAALDLQVSSPSYQGGGNVQINGVVLSRVGSTVTSIEWSWGDGQSSTSWFPASHHFASNGTFVVKVTALDNQGNRVSRSVSVTVNNADTAPVAPAPAAALDLQVSSPSYQGGGNVQINGVVLSRVGSTVTSIEWSWGDGQSSTSWFPASHHFASNGTFVVKVTALDNQGNRVSRSMSVTVR